MNHQPFEDWILNDKKLTNEEKHQLDSHLQICASCAALSETGFALRSTRMVSPAPGFVSRFELRLAAQKIAERRHKLWGLLLLIVTGTGLFIWLAAPYIYTFLLSPVEWVTAGIGYFLFVASSLQTVIVLILVFSKIIPNILPLYAWMMIASALAGFSLLWTVSIWRLSHSSQGVSL